MTRRFLLLAGLLVGAYGAWLMLQQPFDALVEIAVWWGAGVVLHDFLLVPVVLGLGLLASRLLPATWRGTATTLLVVLGSVTLLAVPVLGRFGARGDNPTLLDRPYLTGWLVLVVVVVVAVLVARVVQARPTRTRPPPPDR